MKLRSSVTGSLSLVIVVGLLTMATGCVGTPPNRAELLGTWESHDEGHVVTMQLHGDGEFEVDGLPRAATLSTEQTLNWGDTVDLSGSWSFHEGRPEPFSWPLISVSIDSAGASTGSVNLDLQSGRLDLYYGDIEIGDYLSFDLVRHPSTPSPETVKSADLVGVWRSDTSGILRLRADREFQLDDVPVGLIAAPGDTIGVGPTIDLHGNWSFPEQPLPLTESAEVQLAFDRIPGLQLDGFLTMFLGLQQVDGRYILHLSDDRGRWSLQ